MVKLNTNREKYIITWEKKNIFLKILLGGEILMALQ